jgi:hypothetical protein
MEQLLILNAPDLARLRRSIERSARVVQEGSDRLLVVEGSKEAIGQAAKIPGVSTPRSLAADAAEQLSSGEQLFLAAWRKRQGTMAKKSRKGEGLSWGAKGYRAP